MSNSAELLTLLVDPGRLEALPAEAIPPLIGEAAALQARLWARLQAGAAPTPPQSANGGPAAPDRLLAAAEAAARLGVAVRWMYRHATTLPFTRKLTGGTLRFSERGLERWKESRR